MTQKQTKEIRHHQIIEAAVDEFLKKGYEGASLETIAKNAGLTKGGLYHHFPGGKETVLIAVVNRFMDPLYEMMAKADECQNPVSGLKLFVKKHLAFSADHPKEISFIFLAHSRMLLNKKNWVLIDEYCNEVITFLDSLFKAAVRKGFMCEHDTKGRASALFAALEGCSCFVSSSNALESHFMENNLVAVFLEDLLVSK